MTYNRAMSRFLSSKPTYQAIYYEIETTEGLEFITQQELMPFVQKKVVSDIHVYKGALQCICHNPTVLLGLKTAVAVYTHDYYDVPRPKALLGHQHLSHLLTTIEFIQNLMPTRGKTFYLSAAGSDSSIMTRLKDEIKLATSLIEAEHGDIFLRIRRMGDGWDVLTRLTQRPLATRDWRVCNMQGALNAPLAQAMIWLSRPTKHDKFLNIACGSGTLLIERLAYGVVQSAVGCDINPSAILCATENIAQAGYQSQIHLIEADASRLSLVDKSVDVICADLPFGQLVGSHQENIRLYPLLVREIDRILAPNGRAVIITHEIKLMQSILSRYPSIKVEQQHQIVQRGLHPFVYVLKK
ncbi:MAG: methyltransferase domain-containing protein [Phototrophicales bacterium]|nr:methyltransferase domain-containing protein [Phototrophicales bacterium]